MLRMKIISLAMLLVAIAPSFAEEQRYSVPIGGSPQMGPANAPVTIIEFIDFQ